VSKSYLFVVGNIYRETLPRLNINGMHISWTDSLKYLIVNFISGKILNIDISPVIRKFYAAAISPVIRKFYAAANAIFSHCKYASEFTKLHLLESFTLPLLTYRLNVLFFPQSQLVKLNSCWNSIYRKIFGYSKWESVKEIQLYCQKLDFIHFVDKCKLNFLTNLSVCYKHCFE